MARLRVSVVIPTWNEYPQIVRLLNSLKVQTLRTWEIIVVDKKSTDGTGEYAESVGSRSYTIWEVLQQLGI